MSLHLLVRTLAGLYQNLQHTTTKESTVSGIQSELSDVRSELSGVQNVLTGVQEVPILSTAVNFNQEMETLPDLGHSTDVTDADIYSQLEDPNKLPPVGEKPPDKLFDRTTTEEEFDAVDALLSLGTVRDTTMDNLDNNADLMPIGGGTAYEDVHPVPIALDQLAVDNAIAEIVEREDIEQITEHKKPAIDKTTQPSNENEAAENVNPESKNMDIPTENLGNSPKKGYVKLTTHGIKKKNTDGRSYRCQLCNVKKRSASSLNDHHRRRHEAQMCGVCGKVFELASFLTHHMYSHDVRRYYCDKCEFHSHFESKVTKHKITHHTNPSHQCMYKGCGRWFMRKADLVLHVETHTNNVVRCSKCDYSTTLNKYLKEHMKSHSKNLPYECNICGKKFLWHSGVKAHKEKEHQNK